MTSVNDAVISLSCGAVRGLWRGEPGDPGSSAAFLGIPFADPPVGERRFAPPSPVPPWDGVRDATAYGATAQRGDTGITLIPEPSVEGESTLNVNVFTPCPGDADAALPVLVYIHGGGFTSGSPASPWYDGRAFNRDGVVTVTVSYRLGFDGFGEIPGAPSNRGVRDWLAALEWVQQHIRDFGGDPSRVTIAGQSAGGGAVLTLLGMPAAQHLFHAAWALSPALGDIPAPLARERSERLADLADVAATLEGFRSVSEERLLALQRDAAKVASRDPLAPLTGILRDGLPWGPVIDGELLPRATIESLRACVGAEKALVVGATDDEFTMITDGIRVPLRLIPAALLLRRIGVDPEVVGPYLAANGSQRRKGGAAVIGRFISDSIFRSTVVRAADARGGADTWVYAFSWPSPTRRWSLHCLDVPFWFDGLDLDGVSAIAGDDPPRSLADAVHGSAVALVRDRDPGWPTWASAPGTARVFGGPSSAPDVVRDAYASVAALV
ncbi:carboxylesterase family protein [Microbacterium sp. ABRD28]|uniref:carboxylesterase/lipase family protein n=1 Tax=Microbacterium sp. ABRD28 TaxID=2268461 RepID=UPI000F5589FA|nr:carboxylesterase family protein [Microbacterium sp. ABRD28]AZC15103.1 carboxylesterase/lipase family protein [Microbacterium sp. ABRD28]